MNRYRWPCITLSIALVWLGTACAPPLEELVLDEFAPGTALAGTCMPYGNEQASASNGYCVYHVNSRAELAHAGQEMDESQLQVAYALAPHPTPDWGNWISIRCELQPPVDLRNYHGLKLRFRVIKPSAARLRITLADVSTASDAAVRAKDELWWCDLPEVLAQGSEWQTVSCPFGNFRWGDVGRQNNGRRDLQWIVAYEVNFVSDPGTLPGGTIVLDTLSAY